MREAWSHSVEERNRRICKDACEMSLAEKMMLIDDLYRIRRSLHAMYVRCFTPSATDHQIVEHWARLTCEPKLYLAFRLDRITNGYVALPLPMPDDIRLDAFIRRLLGMEPSQVFCEQYHEPIFEDSPV